MKLMNIEQVGERIYASFDTDQRFEVLFVTHRDNEYFMKVLEHQKIRFYKVSEKDFRMLERKLFLVGITSNHEKPTGNQNHHQQNKID